MIEINFSNSELNDQNLKELKNCRGRLLAREDLGFFKTVEREVLWTSSQVRCDEILDNAEELIVVGIGGSALGAKAVKGFYSEKGRASSVYIWDSLDPLVLEEAWKGIKNFAKSHFLIISKSGSTLETLATAQWLADKLNNYGLDLSQRSTVITEQNTGTLATWAAKNKVPTLEVPLDVGGRFTVLTPVALVVAAFIGLDLSEMRKGAVHAIDDEELVLRLSQESLASFSRQEWITLFWCYSDLLLDLGRWSQQLWAESLAKRVNRDGKAAPRVSTPMVAIGPADQHSLLQQIMEGARDKWVWTIELPDEDSAKFTNDIFESNYQLKGLDLNLIHKIQSKSIRQALDQSGVSVLGLRFKDRSPKSLGYYFMCLELVIGTLGEALNINAFDQPGVESGKVIARELLRQQNRLSK